MFSKRIEIYKKMFGYVPMTFGLDEKKVDLALRIAIDRGTPLTSVEEFELCGGDVRALCDLGMVI